MYGIASGGVIIIIERKYLIGYGKAIEKEISGI